MRDTMAVFEYQDNGMAKWSIDDVQNFDSDCQQVTIHICLLLNPKAGALAANCQQKMLMR